MQYIRSMFGTGHHFLPTMTYPNPVLNIHRFRCDPEKSRVFVPLRGGGGGGSHTGNSLVPHPVDVGPENGATSSTGKTLG